MMNMKIKLISMIAILFLSACENKQQRYNMEKVSFGSPEKFGCILKYNEPVGFLVRTKDGIESIKYSDLYFYHQPCPIELQTPRRN